LLRAVPSISIASGKPSASQSFAARSGDLDFSPAQLRRIARVYRAVLPAYGIVCAISASELLHRDSLLAASWTFQGLVALAGAALLFRVPEDARRIMQTTFSLLVAAFLVRVGHAANAAEINMQSVTAPLVAGAVVTHTIFPSRSADRFNKVLTLAAAVVAVIGLLLRQSIAPEHVLSVIRFALCAFGVTFLTEFTSALQSEHSRLRSDHAVMESLALSDALTQLANRRACEDVLEREMARSRRHHEALSVILVDVDNFKTINDQFGHDVGDAVLTGVARIFREHLRACDEAGRWAGDEFLITLPSTALEGALVVAERVRGALAQDARFGVGGVTASFGVATFDPQSDDMARLLSRADKGLYRAKACGRNRVGVIHERQPAQARVSH
jgi:diguanylate cyclase (GGDEF)-like protein